jgi:hypothetical protein
MPSYLLIQSRDPFESADVASDRALARDLARSGEAVTVLLVQNGVLSVRRGASDADLETLAPAGVRVLADSFSLRERAIGPGAMRRGIEPAALDVVVDALAAGDKVLWL